MGVCLPLSSPCIPHHISRPPSLVILCEMVFRVRCFCLKSAYRLPPHAHVQNLTLKGAPWIWTKRTHIIFPHARIQASLRHYLVKKLKLHQNIAVIGCASLDKNYQNYRSLTTHCSPLTKQLFPRYICNPITLSHLASHYIPKKAFQTKILFPPLPPSKSTSLMPTHT